MINRYAGRRFSWLRAFIVVAVISALGAGVWYRYSVWDDQKHAIASGQPWFGGYVDVTATPMHHFELGDGGDSHDAVLAFVVAEDSSTCSPHWGAAYSLDEASSQLDLDRRIERLRSNGHDVVVSFGGQANTDLGDACGTTEELVVAYSQVVDRYELSTIDLDIEGEALGDSAAITRRAEAIHELQQRANGTDSQLKVWLTLPIAPTGLTDEGLEVVRTFLAEGVDITGVNAMTMNFGTTDSLMQTSVDSLKKLHDQLHDLYRAEGEPLGDSTIWRKIGATPMIGQTDIPGEVFTLEDAQGLSNFARDAGIGRMSLWSVNRDRTCGPNYPDTAVVSDSCSGIDQGDESFVAILAQGFTGKSGAAPKQDGTAEPPVLPSDDPETSPYPIWSEDSAFLAGNKVVWHGNVYQAKWWTQGDVPDDPVALEWETPWVLIGPVLEGESPLPQSPVPEGVVADWDPDHAYKGGEYVVLDGTVYRARWWTQGESPNASFNSPGTAPWVPLDPQELQKLIEDKEGRGTDSDADQTSVPGNESGKS